VTRRKPKFSLRLYLQVILAGLASKAAYNNSAKVESVWSLDLRLLINAAPLEAGQFFDWAKPLG
jgi:hypothetical protein